MSSLLIFLLAAFFLARNVRQESDFFQDVRNQRRPKNERLLQYYTKKSIIKQTGDQLNIDEASLLQFRSAQKKWFVISALAAVILSVGLLFLFSRAR
jgi:hypothetical protein